MSALPAAAPERPRLWVVRHAQPQIAPGLCYGASDVPVAARDNHEAARLLANALPQTALIAHSPLQRCELLAIELQRLRPDLTSKPDPRLVEMDFGLWEGQAWSAIGQSAVDAWVQDFAHHAPGGGESLAHMLTRVEQSLGDALAAAHTGSVHDIVWISHAGVARCVRWLLHHGRTGGGPARPPESATWPQEAPAFGSWEIHSLAVTEA